MDPIATMPPTVLIAVSKEQWLPSALGADRFAVIQVHSGALARDVARDVRPDVIILEETLPDMSGVDACRLLYADPQIGHYVRILSVARDDLTALTTTAPAAVVLAPFSAGQLAPFRARQLEQNLGRFTQARAWYEVALRVAEGLRDRRPEVESLRALGYVCLALGNYADGSRYFQRS